jgi:hypothetical protein
MNILAAIDDPNLLGASIRDPDSWKPWRAALAAAFGLPLFSASARGALRRRRRLSNIYGCVAEDARENRSPWP